MELIIKPCPLARPLEYAVLLAPLRLVQFSSVQRWEFRLLCLAPLGSAQFRSGSPRLFNRWRPAAVPVTPNWP